MSDEAKLHPKYEHWLKTGWEQWFSAVEDHTKSYGGGWYVMDAECATIATGLTEAQARFLSEALRKLGDEYEGFAGPWTEENGEWRRAE